MMKSKMLAGLSLVAGLVIAVSGASVAQDAIAKRKEIMKGVGASAKLTNEMIKGEKPYDAKAATEAVTKISGAWPEFVTLFPKGSETGGETTAHAKIWESPKEFDEKGKAMASAASKAIPEAGKGLDALKAAFGPVGSSCKGCHDVYRIPKK